MKKKTLFTLTLATVLFAISLVLPASAANIIKEGDCGENAVWVLDDAGTLTVKGMGEVTGGLSYAGYYAGEDAFGNNGITTLIFEEGITAIDDEAYLYGSNITSVRFPNSLVSIGNNVFNNYEKLKDVYIPAGVSSIGVGNFDGCNIVIDANNPYLSIDSHGVLFNKDKTVLYRVLANTDLTSYAVPYGVTAISENAFSYCRNLSSIALPDTLGSIGSYAFEGTAIKTLHIPSGVWSIGERALGYPDKITVAPENGVYRIDEFGALLSATELLYFHDKNAVSYAIPYGITHIGAEVFKGCTALAAIGIPDTVVSIGDYAFNGCSSLTRMDFSATSLTTVGDLAFYGCSSLKKFIPSKTLKSIGYDAFSDCKSLSTLNFSDCPLEEIGESAFINCTSLYSIDLPEKMKHLGTGAFYNCTKLEELTIPDGVPHIGAGTFDYCTSLEKLVIPPSVIKIDGFNDDYSYTAGGVVYAFYNCPKLTIYGYSGTHAEEHVMLWNAHFVNEFSAEHGIYAIKFKSLGKYTPPKERTILDSETFDNITWTIDDLATLTISGTGILDLGDEPPEDFDGGPWWLTDPWAKYSGVIKKIVVEEGITEIHDSAFAGGHSLREVVLPRSLTAYDGWLSNDITVCGYEDTYAESLAKEHKLKFEPIRETVTVEINNGEIKEESKPAESGKGSVEKVTLIGEGSVETGYSWEIYSDGHLKIVSLNDVPSGRDWLRYSKEKIKRITFTSFERVKTLGDEAFCEFPNVESIVIENAITKIGDKAFRDCTKLTSISLPASVAEIGDEAFSGCSSLTSIVLSNNVTKIGMNAFKGCESLKRIVFPKYMKEIAIYMDPETETFVSPFADCKNLTVYGYTGTKGESYAKRYNIPFVPIDEYFDPHAFAEDHPEITLTVDRAEIVRNGNSTPLEVPAQILDGRTLVPLRAIFEALGASVDWEGTTQTVTSVRGNKTVILTVGVPSITVNGEAKPLDVPAQIVNGRTLVPARAVAEAFGCEVVWVPETRTVVII